MYLTLEAGDCPNGPCPTIYACEDPELTVFQGIDVPEAENVEQPIPGDRRVALPTEFVLDWAAAKLGVTRR
jgi:hypothetical protein